MKTPALDGASPQHSDATATAADARRSGDRAESIERSSMPTSGLILGPHYPVLPPGDTDYRLWRGADLPDAARPRRFTGTVRSVSGEPVPDARRSCRTCQTLPSLRF